MLQRTCLGRHGPVISADPSITHLPLRAAHRTHEIPSKPGWGLQAARQRVRTGEEGEGRRRRKVSAECFERILEKPEESHQVQRGRICCSRDESLAGNAICVAGKKPVRF